MPKLERVSSEESRKKQGKLICLSCGTSLAIGEAVFYLTASYCPSCAVRAAKIREQHVQHRQSATTLISWWVKLRAVGFINKKSEVE